MVDNLKNLTNNLGFIDEGEEFSSGQPVDFASILWRQLDRILKAGSYGADRLYVNSVNELHQILLPHHDKEYRAFMEDIHDKFAVALLEYPPHKRDQIIPQLEKKMAFRMFGQLIKLMTKKGLLPEKAISR